jgi:MFS family permease
VSSRRHYAWTILALCFFAILAAQGVRLSFGVFVRPWEEAFGASRGTITLIGSLSFLVYGGSQPFVGRAVDRFGIRRTLSASTLLVAAGLALSAQVHGPVALALTYGIVASLGFGGASGVAASVAVTYWFTARRGLAFALVEAGFGAGQLLIVPAALVAISAVGWRDVLLGGAVLLSVGVAPVLWRFLRDRPSTSGCCRSAARCPRPRRRRRRPAVPRRTRPCWGCRRCCTRAASGRWRCRSSSAASRRPASSTRT